MKFPRQIRTLRGSEVMQVVTLSIAGAWWINWYEPLSLGAMVNGPVAILTMMILGGMASWLDHAVFLDDNRIESVGWHEEDGFMPRGGFALTGIVIWFWGMLLSSTLLILDWVFHSESPLCLRESLVTASSLTWFAVLGLVYCVARGISRGLLGISRQLMTRTDKRDGALRLL